MQKNFIDPVDNVDNHSLSMLADSISHLAWMADKDGWIYWYNKRWYEYTGTTKEQMESGDWSILLHPDQEERVVNFVKQAWTSDEHWELTFPIRRADGEFRWFLTRVFPVKDREGNTAHWVGTHTDVHQQRQLEMSLRESEQRYRQLSDELESKVLKLTLELQKSTLHFKEMNEQLERFQYASSHDLQEPIRKIALFAGKIRNDDHHSTLR